MKRFIIEDTKFTEYDLTVLTAVRMRNAVNDLNHDNNHDHSYVDVCVMDYFVMNSGVAPRESEVIATVVAIANGSGDYYSRDDVRAALRRLSRNGNNKFLRCGRRSHSIRGERERLFELNYFHADECSNRPNTPQKNA